MTETPRSGLALDELSDEIRPQDDLFRHVNGRWLERTEIPEDKARWGAFHLIAEQAEKDVRAIVEESQQAEPGTEARKIGDLFASFMDTARIDELGRTPIEEQLRRVDEVHDVAGLLRLTGEFEREGMSGLIALFVEPDPGDPTRYVPVLYQGGLSMPDESYYRLDNFADTRDAYRAHIERILDLAGVADAADDAARVFALETEIATHHWSREDSRDAVKTYNLKSWDDTVALAGIDLAAWRAGVAPGREDALAEVVVYQPSFVESLGELLVAERLDDWKAWLRFKVVHSAAAFLPDAFVAENFSFYGTQLTGVPVNRERWKRGVSLAEAALGEAIGKVYVERHFPPAAKEAMDGLVAHLIEAYRRSIRSLEWMTAETRERALAKLDAFTPKIGYPVRWKDYGDLEISADDLIGNVRRANVWEHDRQLAKVGQPIDRDEWHMTPQTVNAYYNPLMNEIVFPAAILQYPFFDADRDSAANFGGIGAVIGHEIGHGFDDQGSRFDGDGSLRDWWTDADRAAFEERTKALIAQYDALVPEGLSEEHHVNGALTIGENIGDLGGLGIAISAYRLSLEAEGQHPEGPVVDGLSGIQRLLLSWAQVWQQKGRDAETIRLLTIDPHSPNEFRCNQIVRNIDAFYEAFEVTEGDALWLDADQRVTIW
ncbi:MULTISPECIES: M13 family metallopeptidase [Microbacterium]|uniref:M13 family metallopeptidase n=1 Tax=Microbacterium TaxID=33882 RepID=UPI0027885514|nr:MULTISPECIES: M13-type metalloendopeptidase [Microbacterium]MDQ1075272.1 putative endopeptidase [Microbacterium sp. SORGH_AS_0969]MDQ1115502.1 putative endopeptidase [Microbacterium testaceum]